MTGDRWAEGYEPRYDIDSRDGRQGELWIKSITDALADGRAEVKTDFKFAETGNVYIEHECLRRGKWQPSGIDTTETDTWVFVLAQSECALVVPTELLRAVSRRFRDAGRVVEQPRGSHPTRGVAVKLSQLMNELRQREMLRRQAMRGRAS